VVAVEKYLGFPVTELDWEFLLSMEIKTKAA